MSRKFKFRGITENGQWVYGSLIECGITGKKYIFPSGNDANESDKVGQEGCLYLVTFEVIAETVGQYTGLKDKNGAEIYEGDIVMLPYCDLNDACTLELEGCNYYLKGRKSRYEFGSYDSKYFEVIRNIHERSAESEQ